MSYAPNAVENLIEAARAMLAKGVRPTVDLLVSSVGGSRTTAQKALTEFWESRVPSMLAARQFDESVPEPVQEAISTLWNSAMTLADEKAGESLRAAMAAVRVREAEAASTLDAVAAERVQFNAVLQSKEESISMLKDALASLQEQYNSTSEAGAALKKSLDGALHASALLESKVEQSDKQVMALEKAVADAAQYADQLAQQHAATLDAAKEEAGQRLADTLAAFAVERKTLMDAHAQALDALKAAYVDSEQRLRVELDAQKVESTKLRSRLDAALQSLSAEQASARALAAEIAAHKAFSEKKNADHEKAIIQTTSDCTAAFVSLLNRGMALGRKMMDKDHPDNQRFWYGYAEGLDECLSSLNSNQKEH